MSFLMQEGWVSGRFFDFRGNGFAMLLHGLKPMAIQPSPLRGAERKSGIIPIPDTMLTVSSKDMGHAQFPRGGRCEQPWVLARGKTGHEMPELFHVRPLP